MVEPIGVEKMFAAVLVYESSSAAAGYEPLYEETVTLISATSREHAAAKAGEFGAARQVSYLNEAGETITWSLKHLIDVCEVQDGLGDGAEVYTRHFRDFQAYRTFETMLSGGL